MHVAGPPRWILIPDLAVLATPAWTSGPATPRTSSRRRDHLAVDHLGSRLVKLATYAGGVLHYLRVDLDQLGGVLYSLARGGDYAEVARVDAAGLVVLNQPFTATLDLPALARDPLAALQHPDPGPRPGI